MLLLLILRYYQGRRKLPKAEWASSYGRAAAAAAIISGDWQLPTLPTHLLRPSKHPNSTKIFLKNRNRTAAFSSKIEKTKPPFIVSVLKVEHKVVMFSSNSHFFTKKIFSGK